MASAPVVRAVPVDVVRTLRGPLLRPGKPPAASVWQGDDAPGVRHFAAFDAGDPADDEPIGVTTLLPAALFEEPHATAWQLRGMAVVPARRGYGVGRGLLTACLDHVRAHDGDLVWCNARVSAAGFYTRCGFHVVSAEFHLGDIGRHVRMVRRTPERDAS